MPIMPREFYEEKIQMCEKALKTAKYKTFIQARLREYRQLLSQASGQEALV